VSAQPIPIAAPAHSDIESLVARVPAHLAATQARWLKHFHPCPYWLRMDPNACTCEARPVVDLLLAIARRAGA
jgi:hypothetical protein